MSAGNKSVRPVGGAILKRSATVFAYSQRVSRRMYAAPVASGAVAQAGVVVVVVPGGSELTVPPPAPPAVPVAGTEPAPPAPGPVAELPADPDPGGFEPVPIAPWHAVSETTAIEKTARLIPLRMWNPPKTAALVNDWSRTSRLR